MKKIDQTAAVLAVCLGVDLVVCVLYYFFINGSGLWTFIHWLSIICLLVSEAAGTLKAAMAKRTILGFANISTSIIHITMVFAVSVLFVHFFPKQIKVYMLLNILG